MRASPSSACCTAAMLRSRSTLQSIVTGRSGRQRRGYPDRPMSTSADNRAITPSAPW